MRVTLLIGTLLLLATPTLEAQSYGAGRRQARAQKAFENGAVKLFSRMVRTIPPAERKQMEQLLGTDKNGLAKKMAQRFLGNVRQFLRTTDQEAMKILANRFDDRGNRQRLKAAADVIESVGVELPASIRFMIKTGRSGDLRGVELELATRILVGNAELVRKSLNKSKSATKKSGSPRIYKD